MSNQFFHFKQFSIQQDRCAMKVGTDGVLIGAWVNLSDCDGSNMLDIGTGSGVIALMLAQRCKTAHIEAIEIDKEAASQAEGNASSSIFASRINVKNVSLSDYTQNCNLHFKRIVSNPPYFKDSLKCPDNQRSLARHSDTLSIQSLISNSAEMLAPDGHLALILPFSQKEILLQTAKEYKLFPVRITDVCSREGLQPKRILTELSKKESETIEINQLVIEISPLHFTSEYIQLTKDFYLKM